MKSTSDMQFPDLNLLIALDLLLEEQSVTAAAHRMDLSPAAMSRTLTRIREALGDPILVRAGKRLVPTPRSLEIREQVKHITQIAVGLMQPAAIDRLETLQRQFTIRASDVFVAAYGGRLTDALRGEAPGVTLRLLAENEIDNESLREGRIDLWIGVTADLDPEARVQTLFTTSFVGLAHRSHPIFGAGVTVESFVAYEHIHMSRLGANSGAIDVALGRLGLSRKIAVVAPNFGVGLSLLATMPAMLMVAPLHIVWTLGALMPVLRVFRLPIESDKVAIRQAWHPRRANDAALQWLRATIQFVCREQPPPLVE